jgi:hypothetical protein
MERVKRWKKKILDSCRSDRGDSPRRLGHRMVVLTRGCLTLSSIGLIGCTTLKKAGIVSLGAGGGALVGTVLSGGVAAPILGATATAFVTDVVTEAIPIGNTGKKLMNDCAPDNFWSLLGSLVEMGGWFLLLLILVPMVLGWILPGPLEKKKKKDSAS